VLDERAHLRELVLLVGRKILRRKLGVGDDYSLRAHLTSGFYERKNFHTPDVPGREDHVVLGDQLNAASRGFGNFAVGIEHCDRRRGNSVAASSR